MAVLTILLELAIAGPGHLASLGTAISSTVASHFGVGMIAQPVINAAVSALVVQPLQNEIANVNFEVRKIKQRRYPPVRSACTSVVPVRP